MFIWLFIQTNGVVYLVIYTNKWSCLSGYLYKQMELFIWLFIQTNGVVYLVIYTKQVELFISCICIFIRTNDYTIELEFISLSDDIIV